MAKYYVSGEVRNAGGALMPGVTVRAYNRTTGALLGVAVSADGNPLPSDPHGSNVVLLVHGDTAPAVDLSAYGHTLAGSAMNNSSNLRVFSGNNTITMNGGDLTVASNAAFALPGDFTLEANVFHTDWSPGLQTLFNLGAYSDTLMWRLQQSTFELWINGNAYSQNPPAAVPTGVWHHYALTRKAGIVRFWFNGAQCGTGFPMTTSLPARALRIGVSTHYGGEYIAGSMSNFRMTAGVARYSSAFIPPSDLHPVPGAILTPALGSFKIAVGATSPGETEVVFVSPDVGGTYNDVIHRTTPYLL